MQLTLIFHALELLEGSLKGSSSNTEINQVSDFSLHFKCPTDNEHLHSFTEMKCLK